MKVCDKCGYNNNDGDVFCLKCGHMIGLTHSNTTHKPTPAPDSTPKPNSTSIPTPTPNGQQSVPGTKKCDKCGKLNLETTVFCQNCGHMIGHTDGFRNHRPNNPSNTTTTTTTITPGCGEPTQQPNNGTGGTSSLVDSLNEFIGNENSRPLKWTDMFVDVFKKHSRADAEDLFIYGTRRTTPPLYAVSAEWPKPWLYSRVLVILMLTYFLLALGWELFGNSNMIPGMIALGSLAMPLSVVILFYEFNAYRNISVYRVALYFLIGGGASLLATLLLYEFVPFEFDMDYIGASLVSIVEETGKLFIVYLILKRLPERNYIMNGLLIGATIGAGFATFESAGYAFNSLLDGGSIEEMKATIYLRAFLSPGGHITWTAIGGAALMIAKGGQPLSTQVLKQRVFWRLMLFPLVMHMLWDSPFMSGLGIIKYAVLVIAVWIVTLILLSMGLTEVSKTSGQ